MARRHSPRQGANTRIARVYQPTSAVVRGRDARAHVGNAEGRGRSGTILRYLRHQRDEPEVFVAGVAGRRGGVWRECSGDDSKRDALSFSATRRVRNLHRGAKRASDVDRRRCFSRDDRLLPRAGVGRAHRDSLRVTDAWSADRICRRGDRLDSRIPELNDMNSDAKSMSEPLPREMMEHTYPILYEVEQSHWWHIGRRRILERFVEEICRQVTDRRPRILDVGCGTGANLLMLSKYGQAEGVDVSEDALAFCRARGLADVKLGAGEELPYADGTLDRKSTRLNSSHSQISYAVFCLKKKKKKKKKRTTSKSKK